MAPTKGTTAKKRSSFPKGKKLHNHPKKDSTSTGGKKAVPLKRYPRSKTEKSIKLRLTAGTIRYGLEKQKILHKIKNPKRLLLKKRDTRKPVPRKLRKPTLKKEKEGKKVEKDAKKVVKKSQKVKSRNYYPTEDKLSKKRPMKGVKCPKLKSSLTPGTVCIVVAGPHKGKRVIFLKQFTSGLCLITGPFTLNKCPLRRINQIYLIGTRTKVNLGDDFTVPDHINDNYFRRVKLNSAKPKKEEGDIFASKKKKYCPNAARKSDQKKVDVVVMKAINKSSDKKPLCAYLANKFKLGNKQYPHALQF